MKTENDVERVSIDVPRVTGSQAEESSELLEKLVAKYRLSDADSETLFNAVVALSIRGRMVYGDRQPGVCGVAAALGEDEVN